jgi:hypothetical protein
MPEPAKWLYGKTLSCHDAAGPQMAATCGLRQACQDFPEAEGHGLPIGGSRFHQTLRGWMAGLRPARFHVARFHVGSAAAVLRKAQDFSRIGGSENPAAHYFGR